MNSYKESVMRDHDFHKLCSPDCAPVRMSPVANEQDNEDRNALDMLWLELTNRCNLECVHCYAESGPNTSAQNRMNPEDWISCLQEAYSLGCRKVQFIGGEPTLEKSLPRLLERARTICYPYIEIFTNGTGMSAPLKKAIKEYNIRLAFSFYSAQKTLHERITKRDRSFLKTIDNIQWALREGVIVRVAIIDICDKYQDVEEATEFLQKMGVGHVSVDSVRAVGRGSALRSNIDLHRRLCGNCWNKLCVTSGGEVYPCVFARDIKLGTYFDGLTKVWESTVTQRAELEVSYRV